jgi:DUF4097 and DUF4098 domain-containing protein YvlB
MIWRFSWIFIVLLILSGCEWNSDDDDSDLYQYEVLDTYLWSADDYDQLTVSSVNGTIEAGAVFSNDITLMVTRRVTGYNESEVESRIDSITIDTTSTNGHLTVAADMPNYDDYNYSADFEILAPPDLSLELRTVNGSVSADGFSEGWLFSSVNGSINVSNHNGSVECLTVNGNIVCDLASLGLLEHAEIAVTNGDVELLLPVDVSASFMASTTIGTVELLGFPSVTYEDFEKGKKSGDIGSGNAAVTIVAVIGDITIQARD